MKPGFTLLICLLVDFCAAAQPRPVQGRVQDADTKEGIRFCKIRLFNDSIETTSDTNGKFTLMLSPGALPSPWIISSAGYTTDTVRLSSLKNEYTIYLVAAQRILEEVVVTGVSRATAIKENPVSIVAISAQAIERSSETNIIDVLVKNSPGLNAVKTGPNISKPFIRGLGYNRVLTLYDGVRQEGQQWGDEHGIEVDAYGIEKAEVIKGPASLMFGSDALAGVVSLFPFLPRERDGIVRGRLLSEYQSNNGLIGQGLRLAYGDTHWMWTFGGSCRMAKNYTNRIDGKVYNTGFDEKNLSGVLGYRSKNGYSRLHTTLYDNLQGIPDGSRDSVTRKFTKQIYEGASDNIKNRPVVSETELDSYHLSPLHQHIQHFRLYTNSHYSLGKGDMDALVGFQQNIRREFDHPTDPGQAGLYVRLHTLNYGFHYTVQQSSTLEISTGLNGMYQNNKTRDATDFPIPDYHLMDIGAYGYAQWTYRKLILSGGLRYDVRSLGIHNFFIKKNPATGFDRQVFFPDTTGATLQFSSLEKRFNGISFSLGGSYLLTEQISFKANVARGYRSPNIAEIASHGLDPGAHIVYLGNRNFMPEFSFQEDVGIFGNFKDIGATISLFNNSIQHYIYLSELADAQGNPVILSQGNKTFQYQQASAHLYGMEATLNLHPSPIKGFSLNNNFSLVYGNNTRKEFDNKGIHGQYLPFIPPAKVLSSVRQEIKTRSQILPFLYFTAEVDISAAQNRFMALYHTETQTRGYTLINTAIGGRLNHGEKSRTDVQLQINNLFDANYQSNLSRLKYFEYYAQSPNGHLGMFGMGRNICAKIIVAF